MNSEESHGQRMYAPGQPIGAPPAEEGPAQAVVVKPRPEVDVPLEEAVKDLTGFEVIEIEKRYRSSMDNLGGTKMLIGTVHAYKNRGDGHASWQSVEGMTLREMTDFFAESTPDPDDDQGKE